MTKHLTTDQAAKILRIQPSSVSKAIKRGRLQAVKFGIQWMIDIEDVFLYQEKYSKSKK